MSELSPISQFEEVVDEILAVNGQPQDQFYARLAAEMYVNRHLASPTVMWGANFGDVSVSREMVILELPDEMLSYRRVTIAKNLGVQAMEGTGQITRTLTFEFPLSYAMASQLAGEYRSTRQLEDAEQQAVVDWLKSPLLTTNPSELLKKLSEVEEEQIEKARIDAKKLDAQFNDIHQRDIRPNSIPISFFNPTPRRRGPRR